MKICVSTVALLLFSLSPVAAQQSNLIRQYDRFENRTRYWTRPAYVRPDLDMTVTFSFRGQGAGHDIEGFTLIFSSVSADWRYLKNSRLYCLIDGKSVDLGVAKATDSDVKAEFSSVQVKEILAFPVKYQLLQKIAAARAVEIRLGPTEFSLKEYVRTDIKELLSKVEIVK